MKTNWWESRNSSSSRRHRSCRPRMGRHRESALRHPLKAGKTFVDLLYTANLRNSHPSISSKWSFIVIAITVLIQRAAKKKVVWRRCHCNNRVGNLNLYTLKFSSTVCRSKMLWLEKGTNEKDGLRKLPKFTTKTVNEKLNIPSFTAKSVMQKYVHQKTCSFTLHTNDFTPKAKSTLRSHSLRTASYYRWHFCELLVFCMRTMKSANHTQS